MLNTTWVIFLVIQDSSIDDIASNWLVNSVRHLLILVNDHNDYNDFNVYNDFNDYNDYKYNDYNDYNDNNDYNDYKYIQ